MAGRIARRAPFPAKQVGRDFLLGEIRGSLLRRALGKSELEREGGGARGKCRQLQTRAFGGPACSRLLRGIGAGPGCGWVWTTILVGRDGAARATQRAGWAPEGPGRRALRQSLPNPEGRPPDGSATQRSEPLRDGTSPGDTAVRSIGSVESRPRPCSTDSDS